MELVEVELGTYSTELFEGSVVKGLSQDVVRHEQNCEIETVLVLSATPFHIISHEQPVTETIDSAGMTSIDMLPHNSVLFHASQCPLVLTDHVLKCREALLQQCSALKPKPSAEALDP